MNPYVSDLALYDIQGTPGVAADISHINSKAKTKVSLHECSPYLSNLPAEAGNPAANLSPVQEASLLD